MIDYTKKLREEKMKLFKDNKVVNWHEHVWDDDDGKFDAQQSDLLVQSARRAYMDVLVCSLPVSGGSPDPDVIRRKNNIIAEAVDRHPNIIKGMAFVNPGYSREAVAEIERCVNELGMIGIKLYNQYFISDPVLHPVIEKCIELDIPILEHAGKQMSLPVDQPFISDGTHFAKVAEKYPEAVIIMAHIGGGGDWQWSLKAIADCPNIYTDISGSVYDEGIIEQTVSYLGAERVLFGTDGSFSQGIGKILAANISEKDKIEILNNTRFSRYLERGAY
ncbi:MAG: amidohydrolase family protein [Clostridia bacterium]|nr:amidohydrolase family protein [Clostridia bacterium]